MRPNSQRAKTAEIFIWIVTGFSLISVMSNLLQYNLLVDIQSGNPVSQQEATSNDSRQMIIALTSVAIFIVSSVMFIQWFRRAYYNQEIKFGNMSTTNGWASGAWFVPIYSLFKPVQMMRELYHNAEGVVGAPDKKISRSAIITWWWALWIFLSLGSNVITRIELNTTSLDGLINLTVCNIVIDILYIPLAFFAVKTIRNYNEMELILIQTEDNNLKAPQNADLLDSF